MSSGKSSQATALAHRMRCDIYATASVTSFFSMNNSSSTIYVVIYQNRHWLDHVSWLHRRRRTGLNLVSRPWSINFYIWTSKWFLHWVRRSRRRVFLKLAIIRTEAELDRTSDRSQPILSPDAARQKPSCIRVADLPQHRTTTSDGSHTTSPLPGWHR